MASSHNKHPEQASESVDEVDEQKEETSRHDTGSYPMGAFLAFTGLPGVRLLSGTTVREVLIHHIIGTIHDVAAAWR